MSENKRDIPIFLNVDKYLEDRLQEDENRITVVENELKNGKISKNDKKRINEVIRLSKEELKDIRKKIKKEPQSIVKKSFIIDNLESSIKSCEDNLVEMQFNYNVEAFISSLKENGKLLQLGVSVSEVFNSKPIKKLQARKNQAINIIESLIGDINYIVGIIIGDIGNSEYSPTDFSKEYEKYIKIKGELEKQTERLSESLDQIIPLTYKRLSEEEQQQQNEKAVKSNEKASETPNFLQEMVESYEYIRESKKRINEAVDSKKRQELNNIINSKEEDFKEMYGKKLESLKEELQEDKKEISSQIQIQQIFDKLKLPKRLNEFLDDNKSIMDRLSELKIDDSLAIHKYSNINDDKNLFEDITKYMVDAQNLKKDMKELNEELRNLKIFNSFFDKIIKIFDKIQARTSEFFEGILRNLLIQFKIKTYTLNQDQDHIANQASLIEDLLEQVVDIKKESLGDKNTDAQTERFEWFMQKTEWVIQIAGLPTSLDQMDNIISYIKDSIIKGEDNDLISEKIKFLIEILIKSEVIHRSEILEKINDMKEILTTEVNKELKETILKEMDEIWGLLINPNVISDYRSQNNQRISYAKNKILGKEDVQTYDSGLDLDDEAAVRKYAMYSLFENDIDYKIPRRVICDPVFEKVYLELHKENDKNRSKS